MKDKSKKSVYEIVTQSIIEKLESGVEPWKKPWKGGSHGEDSDEARVTDIEGLNALLTFGYETPLFLTFNQAKDNGLQIKKGSRSAIVTFWMKFKKEDDSEFMAPRYYRVFNVADIEPCDKLSELINKRVKPPKDHKPIDQAQIVVDGYLSRQKSIVLKHGEPRAYYSPSKDLVMMPEIGFFKTSEGYHCTLFHELTHSTGHTARLNRDGITAANARFGSEVYSKEELVAELGAAFLCASCGIETQEEQNAAYIEGWLKALKSDSKLIFQAASAAQKAADLILDINPVDYGSEKKIKKKGKSKNVA